MLFKTETGSLYEIEEGMVRRVNPDHPKMADGEWIELIQEPEVEIGKRVSLVTTSLFPYGMDDLETTIRNDVALQNVSVRLTTEVVWISE